MVTMFPTKQTPAPFFSANRNLSRRNLKLERRSSLPGLLLAAALSATAWMPNLQAQTWNNGSGGSWHTGSNWTPSGVPGTSATDRAFLVGTGEKTITLSQDVTISQLNLGNAAATAAAANITLDLGGNVLTTSTSNSGQNAAWTSRASSTSGDLSMTVTNGTLNAYSLYLGAGAAGGGKSTVHISGSATTVNLRGDGSSTLPSSVFNQVGTAASGGGIGELFIENGAKLNVSYGSLQVNGIANDSRSSLVRVSGSGSAINAATSIVTTTNTRIMVRVGTVQANSSARLEVLNGASFATDDVAIGMGNTKTTGTVLISGTGTTFASKRVFVGGGVANGGSSGSDAADGIGFFEVTNGASATISQGFTVYDQGTVKLDRATLSLTDTASATFATDSTLAVTLYNANQASSLEVSNALTITGAKLSISLGEGFTASVNDEFKIATFNSRTGTFAGLAEASNLEIGGYTFQILYNANDITLLTTQVVPEPGTVAIALSGFGLLFVARRFRRLV